MGTSNSRVMTAVVLLGTLAKVLWQSEVSRWAGAVALAALIVRLLMSLMHAVERPRLLPDMQYRPVLVTDCDSGVGLSLATKLSDLGVPVYACCLSLDSPGAHILKEKEASFTHIIRMDVTSDQQVEDAVTYVSETLKGNSLWCVVLNPGKSELGELELTPLEDWRRLLEVNVVGAVRVCRAFLPLIRASKGRVLVTGSLLGGTPCARGSAYFASKYALRAICESLRLEMTKWEVSVHLVESGGYLTNVDNPDVQKQNMLRNFSRCSEDVRAAYGGEDYEMTVEEHMRRLITNSSSQFEDIAEEMLGVCLGVDPKDVNTPDPLNRFIHRLARKLWNHPENVRQQRTAEEENQR